MALAIHRTVSSSLDNGFFDGFSRLDAHVAAAELSFPASLPSIAANVVRVHFGDRALGSRATDDARASDKRVVSIGSPTSILYDYSYP